MYTEVVLGKYENTMALTLFIKGKEFCVMIRMNKVWDIRYKYTWTLYYFKIS